MNEFDFNYLLKDKFKYKTKRTKLIKIVTKPSTTNYTLYPYNEINAFLRETRPIVKNEQLSKVIMKTPNNKKNTHHPPSSGTPYPPNYGVSF